MENTWTVRSAMVALVVGTSWCQGQEPAVLSLARDGATEYAIVAGAVPIPAEQTAARELAEYLQKVTGAEFKVVAESAAEPKPAKAIYLGWTAFAAGQGIDCANLGQEESVIRTVGSDLVITGGRPRGTLYGVYDFLQKDLGVHWLDRDTEVVPKRAALALAAMDRRTKPVFRIRCILPMWHVLVGRDPTAWNGEPGRKHRAWVARNRTNPAYTVWPDEYGGVDGQNVNSQNFGLYVPAEKYLAEHPEYYALDKDGKTRRPAFGPETPRWNWGGCLCLTHPEVRKIALATMLDLIAADRKTVNPNQPPPTIYDISQHDDHTVCHCPACRALVEREGSESGPLIDFINELADGVRAKYPEVKVQTCAYMWSQVPPKTLRPRSNVIILWCDWGMGDAPSKQSLPEPWHPLTSPFNSWRAENLRQWAAITPGGVRIWDYGEAYATPAWPFTMAPVLVEDMRFFGELRPVGLYIESEEWGGDGSLRQDPQVHGQFSALYNWLAMQLMIDPRQPVEPLLDTFFAGYYGPAAVPLRAFYDKLAAAQRELPARRTTANALGIKHVTPAFFTELQAFLEEAEAACAADSLELAHVQRERWRFDFALLECWEALSRKTAPGTALPFDREATQARVENCRTLWIRLGYPEKAVDAAMNALFEKLKFMRLTPPALPDRFGHLRPGLVAQYYWPHFTRGGASSAILVSDPKAADGKAFRIEDTSLEKHTGNPVFGLWDAGKPNETGPTITIARAEIPQDGGYHWYRIGRYRISGGVELFGHGSWGVRCLVLAKDVFDPNNELPDANDWTVWVSAKLTGPAYIKDSQEKENGFYLDRVVLVKPDKGDGEK